MTIVDQQETSEQLSEALDCRVSCHFVAPYPREQLPVYFDNDVQSRLSDLATAKGVDISDLVNDLLK